MPSNSRRPRRQWFAAAALTALCVLALAACGRDGYPNSTFHRTTEFNTAISSLWDRLLFLGTVVFVIVEGLLVYTVVRFRSKPGAREPRHVHGNTTLEILWTAIPAVILVFIAVPTVRTIFRTQAKAVSSALQVEVIGHQWWWEFRYPQYGVITANELYLPVGRTVNFSLRTNDVLHSFWIPRLGGKRDLIANHTNYLWFTVNDSLAADGGTPLNGSCNEYCGTSHANMKFRVFTVPAADFAAWVAHQQTPAAFGTAAPAAATTPAPAAPAAGTANRPATSGGDVALATAAQAPATTKTAAAQPQKQQPTPPAAGAAAAVSGNPLGAATQGQTTAALVPEQKYMAFPREKLQGYNLPNTPLPNIPFDSTRKGDPTRGQTAFLLGGCVGCHAIKGNPIAVGNIGPNLTHIGSRYTIAGAQYPNDTEHLVRWIKNARLMKPGSQMPTLGKGQIDPVTKAKAGILDDQQIADVVAYLQALK
ncbi:MAG TPA: cytochrome c oxidase subunit II [Gemmatimonadaceae bacterium]|nr:cytochrome c oxidase subunit II [Gemmatimonadaceae bacterium]